MLLHVQLENTKVAVGLAECFADRTSSTMLITERNIEVRPALPVCR